MEVIEVKNADMQTLLNDIRESVHKIRVVRHVDKSDIRVLAPEVFERLLLQYCVESPTVPFAGLTGILDFNGVPSRFDGPGLSVFVYWKDYSFYPNSDLCFEHKIPFVQTDKTIDEIKKL